MKLIELHESHDSSTTSDAHQEFVVDNVKLLRSIAKQHQLVINLGSGNMIMRNKVPVGYTYHVLGIYFEAKLKAEYSTSEGRKKWHKTLRPFWVDVFNTFSKSYNISAGVQHGGPYQKVTSVDRLMQYVMDSKKFCLTHKHVEEDKDIHKKKMLAHLNKMMSFIIDYIYGQEHPIDDYIRDKIKKVEDLLASEKEHGYSYPDIEAKMDPKAWKEEFRKNRLLQHKAFFKENTKGTMAKNRPKVASDNLIALIADLERDERQHGFKHPEMEKEMEKVFPKAKRSLIYWQKILNKENPTPEDIMKHLLTSLKQAASARSYEKLNNILGEISMARKAGFDTSELKSIEKSIETEKARILT